MIRKNWKLLLVTSVVLLIPMVMGLLLWGRLPAQIPYHWNVSGEVDGWCGKSFAVFGMPVILLAFHWLCVLASSMDPKGKNHSGKALQLVLWLVPVLSVMLHTCVYLVSLGQNVRVEVVMPVFMGLLFAMIGNYLPKCKQNYTIGIKIPWTLNSEENWNRTHRLAGRLWLGCGIAIMLTAFFDSFWIFLVILAVMVLVPLVYSYTLHKKGI